MREEYKQAAFELFEELLIKYDLYSQITTQLFEYKETLREFFDNYYSLHSGDLNNFITLYGIYSEWINGLIKLREKYKIYRV